mmetsp:Transcript_38608/g.93552  ORF Transcript_38608/g.93552 Transcript_38608/m.93552 type:complete len:714 (-) Transcript_38608:1070-3211(-)
MRVPAIITTTRAFLLLVLVSSTDAWLSSTSTSSTTTTTPLSLSWSSTGGRIVQKKIKKGVGRTTTDLKMVLSTPPLESFSSSSSSPKRVGLASDEWLKDYFHSDIDDANVPPSLSIIRRSFTQLASGSDIRGEFIDHGSRGRNMGSTIAQSIGQTSMPALTPFAAHCFGHAFATMVVQQQQQQGGKSDDEDDEEIVICIGRDPREHGLCLADAFARGAGSVPNVKVVYTGIATTPAMFEFCRSSLCHGAVMVTASHLPRDRNGFKFFSSAVGGFTKPHIHQMVDLALDHCQTWFDDGSYPPRSGIGAVFASEYVDWMPHYEQQLKNELIEQSTATSDANNKVREENDKPLKGLNIVLNAGNGSGSFFHKVLSDMGADVHGSIHTEVDGSFPHGVPNPENANMISETIDACKEVHADLGILLDTDADRCGMVARRYSNNKEDGESGSSFVPMDYEAINGNRLIALMGVIYARQAPGCAIVTDSVTSNGLSKFLRNELGLNHVRYLRGYANVIEKAKLLIQEDNVDAQVAIETSGHCAVRENGFLDDGTFTAIKVLGLLAEERNNNNNVDNESKTKKKSLLDLISALEEHAEVSEFRLPALDGSLESMRGLFDFAALEIEMTCDEEAAWTIDDENLEGIRVSLGGTADSQKEDDNGYFLIRKSLHDPVVCLQVEARSKEDAMQLAVLPLLKIFQSEPRLASGLDFSDLSKYVECE